MSSPVMPEPAAVALSRRDAARARVAVALARVLSRLSPQVIRAVMQRVLRDGATPPVAEVEYLRGLVVSVSTLCAGEGCLPRSIATALLARWSGWSVTWCTGVHHRPFTAHAWVEVDGAPVAETADLGAFRRILVCGPRPPHVETAT